MKSNITSEYRMHDSLKLSQGDILRDVNVVMSYEKSNDGINEFLMPYVVILSQDCDLDLDFKSYKKYLEISKKFDLDNLNIKDCSDNDKKDILFMYDKRLPSILVCPAFPAKQLREGYHLNNYQNFFMQHINSCTWGKIKINEIPRYHYLKEFNEFQIPDLVLDFKRYYTLPTDYVYNIFEDSYIGSLNELFRENLSARFSSYLSRIGMPDFKKD